MTNTNYPPKGKDIKSKGNADLATLRTSVVVAKPCFVVTARQL